MNGSNSLVQEKTRDYSVSTNIANVYHTINYKFLPLMCFAVMWINVFKMSSCYWVQLVHTCENWGWEFDLIIHINRHLYGEGAEGRALSKNIWLAFTMLWVPFPGTQINKILKWFGDIKRIVTFKKEHGLCCPWGPYEYELTTLLPETIMMSRSMVLQQPGSLLMSVACVATRGHADVHSLCCSMKPC